LLLRILDIGTDPADDPTSSSASGLRSGLQLLSAPPAWFSQPLPQSPTDRSFSTLNPVDL
jgi:hypothetical protein